MKHVLLTLAGFVLLAVGMVISARGPLPYAADVALAFVPLLAGTTSLTWGIVELCFTAALEPSDIPLGLTFKPHPHGDLMTTVLQDRLAAIADLPLTAGSHDAPPAGELPCGCCVMEKYAWVTGQEWTDDPENCSPVISAFLRRYNDGTDQDGRNKIDAWVFKNADRLAATANDGRDGERGFQVADFGIRVALPLWLELAGATEPAAKLRAFPEITDAVSVSAVRPLIRDARSRLTGDWWAWRNDLRAKVKDAVLKAMEKRPAAAATTTAAATDAATAAATTAATYGQVYDRVYKAVRERLAEVFAEKFAPAVVPLKSGVIELLDRLVAETPADA